MRSVHGLEQARLALQAVVSRQSTVDSKVDLISLPYAACHAGVGYYAALVKQLREEFPDVDFSFTLCCGDDAAIAHDALRMGFTRVVCATKMQELQDIARAMGAELLGEYPRVA